MRLLGGTSATQATPEPRLQSLEPEARLSNLAACAQDLSIRSLARFGIWNSGRPDSFHTWRAFIISSLGGSENGPESLFCVASRTSLDPGVTLPRASRTEGSI